MISRVHYREQQVLQKEDLLTEQKYRLQMHGLHLAELHSWGVVTGLQLVALSDQLQVQAGAAVDAYGRFLTLADDLAIKKTLLLDQLGEGVYDVWLTYWHSIDASQRRQEEARIRLTESPQDAAGNPQPISDFGETPNLLEEPDGNEEWPIYLGRVLVTATALTVLAVERPTPHLRAGQLSPPASDVTLQLGNEQQNAPTQFALNVNATPQLTVDDTGKTAVYAQTHLHEPIQLNANSQFHFDTAIHAPEAATPWQFYRTAVADGKVQVEQLRLELFHPGDKGNPADNQLVVGFWEDNQFIKCFQVNADKTVTVFGNVEMQSGKQVHEGPIEMNLADERFAATLLGNMVSGMSTAAPQVDAIYNTPLEVKLSITAMPNNRDLTFSYTATVINNKETEIHNVQLLELQVVEGRSQKERSSASPIKTLGQEKRNLNETSKIFPDLPVGQKVSLIVTVIGTMISGEQVQATATKNFVVQQPPPPEPVTA